MKGVRGHFRPSFADGSLLIAAAALLWSARVGLWLMPYARVQRLLARLARPASERQDAEPASPERIAWAIQAVSPFVPGGTCLPRALAAQALLARQGQASDLKIGVARGAGGALEAHAWVECGGRTVIGGSPGLGRYAPLQPLNRPNGRSWVVIATSTSTPLPANTPTPKPTATRTPLPTPVPILVRITPLSRPGPTATSPVMMPASLIGKILFYSDRTRSPRRYALDPANGDIYAVTQEWPYKLAQSREGRSPDGKFTAEVQMVIEVTAFDILNDRPSATMVRAQAFVRDNEYDRTKQLTNTEKWSYDPTWSPAGNRIAYVSAEPGNDEISSANPDGSDMQRLTTNTWEWDKHPSWSPDGSQIVFLSNRGDGLRQLWVMNADGSNQRKLLDSPSNDWDPVWVKESGG